VNTAGQSGSQAVRMMRICCPSGVKENTPACVSATGFEKEVTDRLYDHRNFSEQLEIKS
jgi:hypothetical protein